MIVDLSDSVVQFSSNNINYIIMRDYLRSSYSITMVTLTKLIHELYGSQYMLYLYSTVYVVSGTSTVLYYFFS